MSIFISKLNRVGSVRLMIVLFLPLALAGCTRTEQGGRNSVDISSPSTFEVEATPAEIMPKVEAVLRELELREADEGGLFGADIKATPNPKAQTDALFGSIKGRTSSGQQLRVSVSRSGDRRSVVRIHADEFPLETQRYLYGRIRDAIVQP
jgi:hypothetical protein